MSAPINLNKERKRRARNAKKTRADENAVRFGRTKEEKRTLRARQELEQRRLTDHKREP